MEKIEKQSTYKINYPNFNIVMGNPKLSPGAKTVLYWLTQCGGKNGEIYPSKKFLSQKLGKCTRQIYIYITELLSAGVLIDRWREKFPASNHYLLSEEIYCLSDSPSIEPDRKHTSEHMSNVFPIDSGNIFPPNNKELNNKENNTVSYQKQRDDVSSLISSDEQMNETDKCQFGCNFGLLFNTITQSNEFCSCGRGLYEKRKSELFGSPRKEKP